MRLRHAPREASQDPPALSLSKAQAEQRRSCKHPTSSSTCPSTHTCTTKPVSLRRVEQTQTRNSKHRLRSHSLRRDVSRSPQHSGEHLAIDLVGADLGHAEVRHLGPAVVVQKDVAALEIPVDDGGDGALVQELERPGAVQCDPKPRPPVERLVALFPRGGVEVVLQAAIGHVLEHQQPMLLVGAVTEQADQVTGVQSAQKINLQNF